MLSFPTAQNMISVNDFVTTCCNISFMNRQILNTYLHTLNSAMIYNIILKVTDSAILLWFNSLPMLYRTIELN